LSNENDCIFVYINLSTSLTSLREAQTVRHPKIKEELKETRIEVYKSESTSLKDFLDEYNRNRWEEITVDDTCINQVCQREDKKRRSGNVFWNF